MSKLTGRRVGFVVAAVLLLVGAVALITWLSVGPAELLAASQRVPGSFGPDLSTELAPQGATISSLPPGAETSVSADAEGLYQGAFGRPPCDRARLASYFAAPGNPGQAWTEPFVGDSVFDRSNDLTSYVEHLTPMFLRADTRVTAHRLVGGEVESFQATMQAGTAVLVDDLGEPRVRCVDALPLTSPLLGSLVRHVGREWPGYSAAHEVGISDAGKSIRQFGLHAMSGGPEFRRPIATDGRADFAQTNETAVLDGSYYVSGKLAYCDLRDCSSVQSYSVSAHISGCPTVCMISSDQWDGTLPLTFEGSRWRATGATLKQRAFTCTGTPIPTSFSYSLTVTAGSVVDGIWAATAVSVDYEHYTSGWPCTPARESWAMSGSR